MVDINKKENIRKSPKEIDWVNNYLERLFVFGKDDMYDDFVANVEDILKEMYEDAWEDGYEAKAEEPIDRPQRGYTPTQMLIKQVTDGIRELLFYKNEMYGDSALHPTKIFSKLEADNSICIRIDDKISRIMNGEHLLMNDVIDLMGYLILLCASKKWTDFNKFRD